MIYKKELLGDRIKQLRKEKNWTRVEFGKKLLDLPDECDGGLTEKQIGKYETNVLLPPTDKLLKMCELFDCDLGYLFAQEDYTDKTKIDSVIENELSISPTTLKSIKSFTKNNYPFTNTTKGYSYESDYYSNGDFDRKLFEDFINSHYFSELLSSYIEIYKCAEKIFKDNKEYDLKYDKQTRLKADKNRDISCLEEAEGLSKKTLSAIKDLNSIINSLHEFNYKKMTYNGFIVHNALDFIDEITKQFK